MISTSAIKCLRPRVKHTPVGGILSWFRTYLSCLFFSLTLTYEEVELHSANL